MKRIARPECESGQSRRGIAAMWILAAGPVALVVFGVVADYSKIWLARVELQSAVDSAALAGAKTWGDGSDTGTIRTDARVAAQAFGQANTINGETLTLTTNDNGTGNDNENNNNLDCPTGEILLGQLTGGVLDTTASNPISQDERACFVRKTYTVSGFGSLLGGTYTIQVESAARYEGGAARLSEITSVTCP